MGEELRANVMGEARAGVRRNPLPNDCRRSCRLGCDILRIEPFHDLGYHRGLNLLRAIAAREMLDME